jgi:hypothetical protein
MGSNSTAEASNIAERGMSRLMFKQLCSENDCKKYKQAFTVASPSEVSSGVIYI